VAGQPGTSSAQGAAVEQSPQGFDSTLSFLARPDPAGSPVPPVETVDVLAPLSAQGSALTAHVRRHQHERSPV
jgi:hypothetical protein